MSHPSPVAGWQLVSCRWQLPRAGNQDWLAECSMAVFQLVTFLERKLLVEVEVLTVSLPQLKVTSRVPVGPSFLQWLPGALLTDLFLAPLSQPPPQPHGTAVQGKHDARAVGPWPAVRWQVPANLLSLRSVLSFVKGTAGTQPVLKLVPPVRSDSLCRHS